MKFLALDVGEKRIGVAQGSSETRIAVPVGFIETGGTEWQEIAQAANFYGANRLIIGLPRNNQGQETAQSAYVREFARQLVQQIPGVKVRFQDETLTSVLAEDRLKERGRPYAKGDIDAEAAAIILQDYLDGLGTARDPESNPAPEPEPDSTPVLNPDPAAVPAAESTNLTTEKAPMPKKANKNPKKTAPSSKKGKKTKKKKSFGQKLAITLVVVLVLGVACIGGIAALKALRDHVRKQRAAEYAAREAAMQAEVFNFTVRPGETMRDIQDSLIAAGYSAEEAEEALTAQYDFPMLKKRPRGATLEGYLFGETVEFYEGEPATEIIEAFLSEMQKTIDENKLEAKYKKQGLDLHDGIILASMVQKEAKADDMPTVAQVFLSRLDANMALGSDVTVSYALDQLDPERDDISSNQEALGVDSCYNTRLYTGLPCGPIANPGLSALLAVAEPSDTSYLYFLTGDDGLMYYSHTEEEHLRNAAEHCQELCRVSL